MRQWGAWKLHPYNSIAQNYFYCHFGSTLKILRTMQLLLTYNPLTYLHSQSNHSGFTSTVTLVLTSPYPAYQRTFFFFTWQVPHYNRKTYNLLPNLNPSHSAQILHILGLLSHQKILLLIWYEPHPSWNFFSFICISTMLFYSSHSSTPWCNQ